MPRHHSAPVPNRPPTIFVGAHGRSGSAQPRLQPAAAHAVRFLGLASPLERRRRARRGHQAARLRQQPGVALDAVEARVDLGERRPRVLSTVDLGWARLAGDADRPRARVRAEQQPCAPPVGPLGEAAAARRAGRAHTYECVCAGRRVSSHLPSSRGAGCPAACRRAHSRAWTRPHHPPAAPPTSRRPPLAAQGSGSSVAPSWAASWPRRNRPPWAARRAAPESSRCAAAVLRGAAHDRCAPVDISADQVRACQTLRGTTSGGVRTATTPVSLGELHGSRIRKDDDARLLIALEHFDDEVGELTLGALLRCLRGAGLAVSGEVERLQIWTCAAHLWNQRVRTAEHLLARGAE
eukprot:3906650-Prymnesium_polylepis.1